MKKLINLLDQEKQKIIDKNSNDVITSLILDDYLQKSNNNVLNEVDKQVDNNPENKIFNNINKILNLDNYNTDYNIKPENTEKFKNKIFSIVYNFLISKYKIKDFDEFVNLYDPINNPIQAIEIDNFLETVDKNDILQKLIKILS